MEKKMTYVEALTFAIENLQNEEVVERLTALRATTIKRNTADRKPTKTQVANEEIKADIVAFLADGGEYTVTEIMAGVPSLGEAKPQKASALITQLKNAGVIKRNEVKRKAYFSLA